MPEREPIPVREDGKFELEVNGQHFLLLLKPDRNDCRRWYAFRHGDPFVHGGLEQVWREVQRRIVPLMSVRRLA